ncbi:MAG: hypothetical protein M1815_005852 [Lichina confinis]|nr:MAG: hypothetical protein M1815_005852 [Lichina confinis]
MTAKTTKPSVAFFGATGGCAGTALAIAIQAGHQCTALARDANKLRNLLLTRHGVAESVVDANLIVVEGNVKDRKAVSRALVVPRRTATDGRHASHIDNDDDDDGDNGDDNGDNDEPRMVDVIVCGVGSVPVFKPNPLRPTLEDPTICEDATRTILCAVADLVSLSRRKSLSSLSQQSSSSPASPTTTGPALTSTIISSADAAAATRRARSVKRPLMLVISTTGLSSQGRDVPLLMLPLYHWLLPVPHADKQKMEKLLVDATTSNPATSPISGFVVVRPSLLTDGAMLGLDKVRVGWEVEADGRLHQHEHYPDQHQTQQQHQQQASRRQASPRDSDTASSSSYPSSETSTEQRTRDKTSSSSCPLSKTISSSRPSSKTFSSSRPSSQTSVEQRTTTEDKKRAKTAAAAFHPAIGYTISRADVGNWIADEIILPHDRRGVEDKWVGKMMTLTY